MSVASVIRIRPPAFLPFLDGVVTRTRTLGLRSASAPGVPDLWWSEYSINSDVSWLFLPRVLMVTGVPSSGSEYVDFASPGPDTSVGVGSSSLGVVDSSVGAGSGGAFLELIPIVVFSRSPVEGGGWLGTTATTRRLASAQGEASFPRRVRGVLGGDRRRVLVLDKSSVEEAVKGRTGAVEDAGVGEKVGLTGSNKGAVETGLFWRRGHRMFSVRVGVQEANDDKGMGESTPGVDLLLFQRSM